MLDISPDKIKEIAEELGLGFRCFYNIENGEFESFPDSKSDSFFDDEPWREIMDKVEENEDKYIEFRPLSTRDNYNLMVEFTSTVNHHQLQKRLINALENKRPFFNFKHRLDYAIEYREKWFKFRDSHYYDWVKMQIDDYNENGKQQIISPDW